MTNLQQFQNQEFLCLETFRKNGIGVKTPMWFAQEGDALYLWSYGGKVKRIRNNASVNIAPCKRFGQVTGEWMAGQATIDDSDAAVQHVASLMRKKIGFGFAIFQLMDKLRDRQKRIRRVAIKVSLG
jgi:uncharacterized protein